MWHDAFYTFKTKNMYSKEEIIKLLEKEKLIIPNNKKYIISENLLNLVFPNNGSAKSIPQSIKGLSNEKAYEMFMEMCEIPTYGKVRNSRYIIRNSTKKAHLAFSKILKDPDIDFESLIKKVKAFYSNENNARPKFSNFIIEGMWKQIYNDNLKEEKYGKYSQKGVI